MNDFWMIYIIISVIAVIVEIFVPSLFCINFAIAGVITALISIFDWVNFPVTILIFLALSMLSIIFIRPILKKMVQRDNNDDDFRIKYIGKTAKVIEPVSINKGAITIFDERWEARIKEGEEIPENTNVKIVDNDGLTLFVERI